MSPRPAQPLAISVSRAAVSSRRVLKEGTGAEAKKFIAYVLQQGSKDGPGHAQAGGPGTVRMALVCIARDCLASGLRGQGGLDGGADVVVQEVYRTVAESPVPPARMLAPVMMGVAAVGLPAGLEPLLTPGAGVAEFVRPGNPQLGVGQSQAAIHFAIHPGAGLPAAGHGWIGVRGPLADGERVGRAVGDAGNLRGRALVIPGSPVRGVGAVALVQEHTPGVLVPGIALVLVGGVDAQVVPHGAVGVPGGIDRLMNLGTVGGTDERLAQIIVANGDVLYSRIARDDEAPIPKNVVAHFPG